MKRINCLLLTIWSLTSLAGISQSRNPYKSIGKKSQTLTLTGGKYEEFFDQDSIQQVGSVLMNVRTMTVVKFLEENDAKERLQNEKGSRFLSTDPLTSSFAMLTPYQYASNNPIHNIDLDGLEGVGYEANLDRWTTELSNKKITPEQFENRKMAASKGGAVGVGIGLVIADCVYNQGRGTALLFKFYFLARITGALPHNGTNDPVKQKERLNELKSVAAEGILAFGVGKLLGVGLNVTSNIAKIATNRFNFAKQFYSEAGFSEESFVKHARGIDLSEKVFETTLTKGTKLEQWRKVEPTTGETVPGDYYTLPGADPKKLGIDVTGRVKVTVELNEDTKFLHSTAADIKDTWSKPGRTTEVKGGETQLFQVKVNATIVKQ